MNISKVYRDIIVEEINFAAKKMSETKNTSELLYYFSAIFGVFHRVLNTEYSSELVYAHFILRSIHDGFQNKLNSMRQGDDVVPFSDEQFDKLQSLSKELAKNIKKKGNIDETLKKFVLLLYTTTGNGYYLMQKGWLKV